jgi:putative aldouronate transport system permease protein
MKESSKETFGTNKITFSGEKRKRKMPTKELVFYVVLYAIFIIGIFLMIYPFWNLIVLSFNAPIDAQKGSLTFWPREWTLVNYTYLFVGEKSRTMLYAVLNSVLRTVVGTALNVFISAVVAYAMATREFILRKFMNFYVIIPMYIAVGLIPKYLLYQQLGLLDNFMVYIVPNLLSAYNIIIMRTYLWDLSFSLSEAAKIDGAGYAKIFFKIILPLSSPVLATCTLFIAVFHWGSWQDSMFFAQGGNNLQTLSYEMTKVLRGAGGGFITNSKPSQETLKASITIVTILPIIMIYPFLQRFFVDGMTIGAVKE